MYEYRMEDDQYVLFDTENGDILSRNDEIAIAFTIDLDDQMWTLHKHGNKERVEKWMDMTHRKFMDAGHADLARELRVVSGKFPVEELNRCIDTTGYIEIMIKDLGIVV